MLTNLILKHVNKFNSLLYDPIKNMSRLYNYASLSGINNLSRLYNYASLSGINNLYVEECQACNNKNHNLNEILDCLKHKLIGRFELVTTFVNNIFSIIITKFH
jgi:hypothetical protein